MEDSDETLTPEDASAVIRVGLLAPRNHYDISDSVFVSRHMQSLMDRLNENHNNVTVTELPFLLKSLSASSALDRQELTCLFQTQNVPAILQVAVGDSTTLDIIRRALENWSMEKNA